MCIAYPREGELNSEGGKKGILQKAPWSEWGGCMHTGLWKGEDPPACPSGRGGSLLTQEPMVRDRLARAKRPAARTWEAVGKERGSRGPVYSPECPWRRRGCVSGTGRHRGWVWCGCHSRTPCRGCKHREGRTRLRLLHRHQGNAPLQWDECPFRALGFCLPPLGLPWKQCFVKGRAARSLGDPQAVPYPRTLQGTPSGSMPLSDKPGKSHSGRSSFPASCLPSRQQGWQLWISQEWADASNFTLNARDFLSAPHDSVFTR